MKLHLGCWTRDLPGFINVDLVDLPHIHHKTGIDDLSMFEDDSAELIYSSHNFEYFDRIEGLKVLREWRRVLKPGGTLRIAVPDFDKLIEVYRLTGDANRIMGPLFGRMPINTQDGEKV